MCKNGDKCKFYKKKICAYRHVETNKEAEDFEEEILKLKAEISVLKENIKTKENQLEEGIANEKSKLAFLDKENKELKEIINTLQKENVDLKVETIIQKKIIQSHTDQNESDCRSYICNKCDFEIEEEDALETHKELYHENDNFPCDKCYFKFDEQDDLETHKEKYHQKENFRCDKCDVDFEENDTLATHRELYHQLEYQCDFCDYETSTQRGLNIHKGTKHKERM